MPLGKYGKGSRIVIPGVQGPAVPVVSGVAVSALTTTTATVSWDLSPAGTGRVEYGLTAGYGTFSMLEPNHLAHHSQVIGDDEPPLTPNTLYYYRILSTNGSGQATYVTGTFTTSAGSTGVTYTDYDLTGVTTYGGNAIDATGVVDSAAGLNAWLAAQPDGSDATHRARYIFPPGATYRTSMALCLGNKSYVTVWGHAATSSAWVPGNATSYPNPGCTISNACTAGGAPAHSAFVLGSLRTGAGTISFAQTCTDVIIRGFNVNGNAVTPGIYDASYEVCNAFEVGRVVGCEILYNKALSVPGDFVRVRGDSTVADSVNIHHNWCVDAGRQGISIVEGDTISFDDNVMDRCGYYGIDIEPDDDATLAYRVLDNVLIRRNTFGSFGSSVVAGSFCAIGDGTHTHIADVTISDNVVSGSTYGTYATGSQCRDLTTYVGQHIANSGAAGSDPHIQRLTFTNNSVSHAVTVAGPVFHAGGVDTLVVTGNDTNLASGSFASLGPHSGLYAYTPTNVTNSGNV